MELVCQGRSAKENASKISVLISSFSANTDLIASIILDSSPPDATQDNGCFGSPGLVERINSASS